MTSFFVFVLSLSEHKKKFFCFLVIVVVVQITSDMRSQVKRFLTLRLRQRLSWAT